MKLGPKKHFLNARTNITLNNDVKGRGIMVAMENTVSYDGDHFEILFLTFIKVKISKKCYFQTIINVFEQVTLVQDFIKNISDSIIPWYM